MKSAQKSQSPPVKMNFLDCCRNRYSRVVLPVIDVEDDSATQQSASLTLAGSNLFQIVRVRSKAASHIRGTPAQLYQQLHYDFQWFAVDKILLL